MTYIVFGATLSLTQSIYYYYYHHYDHHCITTVVCLRLRRTSDSFVLDVPCISLFTYLLTYFRSSKDVVVTN